MYITVTSNVFVQNALFTFRLLQIDFLFPITSSLTCQNLASQPKKKAPEKQMLELVLPENLANLKRESQNQFATALCDKIVWNCLYSLENISPLKNKSSC